MFDARLEELGVSLPGPFPPHDPLDAVVVHGHTARTSGCLPRNADGVLHATGLVRVFGDAGRHTRSAIGVAALPRGAPVEVEVTAALREDR